jgi:hypothetical protein
MWRKHPTRRHPTGSIKTGNMIATISGRESPDSAASISPAPENARHGSACIKIRPDFGDRKNLGGSASLLALGTNRRSRRRDRRRRRRGRGRACGGGLPRLGLLLFDSGLPISPPSGHLGLIKPTVFIQVVLIKNLLRDGLASRRKIRVARRSGGNDERKGEESKDAPE